MSFITNITGVPVTGAFGPNGSPSGVNNNSAFVTDQSNALSTSKASGPVFSGHADKAKSSNAFNAQGDGGKSLSGTLLGADSSNQPLGYARTISNRNFNTLIRALGYNNFGDSFNNTFSQTNSTVVNTSVNNSGITTPYLSNIDNSDFNAANVDSSTSRTQVAFFAGSGPRQTTPGGGNVPDPPGGCNCPVLTYRIGRDDLEPPIFTVFNKADVCGYSMICSGTLCQNALNFTSKSKTGFFHVFAHRVNHNQPYYENDVCLSAESSYRRNPADPNSSYMNACDLGRGCEALTGNLGRNCGVIAEAMYAGPTLEDAKGTGYCPERANGDSMFTVYEGTDCSVLGTGSFYSLGGPGIKVVESSTDDCCRGMLNTSCRGRLAFPLQGGPVATNLLPWREKYPLQAKAWDKANNAGSGIEGKEAKAGVFHTGIKLSIFGIVWNGQRVEVNPCRAFAQGYYETISDGVVISGEPNVWCIVPTGGTIGGRNNIEPAWDTGICDYAVTIRRVNTNQCSGDPVTYYDESCGAGGLGAKSRTLLTTCCTEQLVREGPYSGEWVPTCGVSCPVGPTIKIRASELNTFSCKGCTCVPKNPADSLSFPSYSGIKKVNWWSCMNGCPSGTGVTDDCAILESRGPLYIGDDYVCYNDGAGNSGTWTVLNSEFSVAAPCHWSYTLEFYDPGLSGPTRYNVHETGIISSGSC